MDLECKGAKTTMAGNPMPNMAWLLDFHLYSSLLLRLSCLHPEVGELEEHRLVHAHVLHGIIQPQKTFEVSQGQPDAETRPTPPEDAGGHGRQAVDLVERWEALAQHMEGATGSKDDGKAGQQGEAEALLRHERSRLHKWFTNVSHMCAHLTHLDLSNYIMMTCFFRNENASVCCVKKP